MKKKFCLLLVAVFLMSWLHYASNAEQYEIGAVQGEYTYKEFGNSITWDQLSDDEEKLARYAALILTLRQLNHVILLIWV